MATQRFPPDGWEGRMEVGDDDDVARCHGLSASPRRAAPLLETAEPELDVERAPDPVRVAPATRRGVAPRSRLRRSRPRARAPWSSSTSPMRSRTQARSRASAACGGSKPTLSRRSRTDSGTSAAHGVSQEHCLRDAVAVDGSRQAARGELGNAPVEERQPHLAAVRHAAAVGVAQQLRAGSCRSSGAGARARSGSPATPIHGCGRAESTMAPAAAGRLASRTASTCGADVGPAGRRPAAGRLPSDAADHGACAGAATQPAQRPRRGPASGAPNPSAPGSRRTARRRPARRAAPSRPPRGRPA